jgi:hypothetical protein
MEQLHTSWSSWKRFLFIPKSRCGLATPMMRNERISVRVVWGNTEFRVQCLSLYILFCSKQIHHCFSRAKCFSSLRFLCLGPLMFWKKAMRIFLRYLTTYYKLHSCMCGVCMFENLCVGK